MSNATGMVVDGNLAQIGTRESVADTARILGPQSAAVVWRTYGQAGLVEMRNAVLVDALRVELEQPTRTRVVPRKNLPMAFLITNG